MIFSGKRVKTEGKPVVGSELVKTAGVAGGASGVVRASSATISQPSSLGSIQAVSGSSPQTSIGKASLGKLSAATPSSSGTADSDLLLRSRCQAGLPIADHTRSRSPSSSSWW